MKYLDSTFPECSENLACDEWLLERCEKEGSDEVLRFWEPSRSFAVLGYSSRREEEIHQTACSREGIHVYRRISGGGTVLQGPGCLNYSLILRIRSEISNIRKTNHYILARNKSALEPILGSRPAIQGHTDLTLGHHKFSGNAQRRKRNFLLFHGTFLLDFDLALMDRVLKTPIKQPAYRKNRSHSAFLVNLHLPSASIKKAMCREWNAFEPWGDIRAKEIESLVPC